MKTQDKKTVEIFVKADKEKKYVKSPLPIVYDDIYVNGVKWVDSLA